MRRKVTWAVAALMVVPAMLVAPYAKPPQGTAGKRGAAASSSKYTLTVLNPQGPVKKSRDLAPRLGTLEGKKVALWLSSTKDELYAGRGAELFDLLEKMLKEKFPGISVVPYTKLPMKFAPENEVVAAITAVRPDAVVAGFGG
jgi:hypothetical protein